MDRKERERAARSEDERDADCVWQWLTFPDLMGKCADFQSRLDEVLRRAADRRAFP